MNSSLQNIFNKLFRKYHYTKDIQESILIRNLCGIRCLNFIDIVQSRWEGNIWFVCSLGQCRFPSYAIGLQNKILKVAMQTNWVVQFCYCWNSCISPKLGLFKRRHAIYLKWTKFVIMMIYRYLWIAQFTNTICMKGMLGISCLIQGISEKTWENCRLCLC